jgi:hypothetical protein
MDMEDAALVTLPDGGVDHYLFFSSPWKVYTCTMPEQLHVKIQ